MESIPRGAFADPERAVDFLNIEPGMTVADFGAGSGAYVFAIASRMAGSGRVYAIDVQKDLLRRIGNEAQRRGLTNVEVLWGDIESESGSKLHDGSANLVLLSNVLFQTEDTHLALEEALRVLKPTGRLVIIDWSESAGAIGPRADHVVSKETALSLAEKVGFSLVREFPAGEHHYGLIFKRV